MDKTVYLMGPIHGVKYRDCNNWREFAKRELAKYGIEGISPMRHKDVRDTEGIMGDTGGGNIMTNGKGIITRDRYDTTNSSIGLANFLGAKEVSIGTVMEYAWADLSRVPIITVMEKEGNPHEHNFIRQLSGFRVETLEEGIYVARCILTS
jgi:hypothetical protein